MARNSNSKRSKNAIQNVRVVDPDEGSDDVILQRLISAYNVSEGQIRVVCNFTTSLSPSGVTSGIVAFGELLTTDDFVSFSQQYQEFRVKAIQFRIYDLQPNSSPTINYWSTFHQVGGDVPTGFNDVIDRPDSRSISPGDGRSMLAWVAHGIPEMAFQPISGPPGLGGLTYYLSPAAGITGVKYSIVAKFIVDFRGRR